MTETNQKSVVVINNQYVIEISNRETTLVEVLERLNNDNFPLGQHFAIAVNNSIVTKQRWSTHSLNHEDKINIFGAIAGG